MWRSGRQPRGEGLGALDHRGSLVGGEAADTGSADGVADARHQRRLGADDDEIGGRLAGQRHDGGRIRDDEVVQFGVPGDAWVARSGVQFGHVAVRGQGTGERVLAAA